MLNLHYSQRINGMSKLKSLKVTVFSVTSVLSFIFNIVSTKLLDENKKKDPESSDIQEDRK